MRFVNRVAACLGLMLASAPATSAEFSLDDVMAAIAGDVIRPSYDALNTKAGDLEKAVTALCATPSGPAHEAANDAFSNALSAWSRAEIFREGPVMQDNRLERLLFYPDRKGTGLKQVQAALAEADASAADAASLAGKSVAMQGFGALEFVLFGTDADQLETANGAYRCQYGAAIAANIRARAGELSDAWVKGGQTDRLWNSHDATNPFFRTDREAMNLVLGTLIHGLEMMRDVRIGSFLDVKDGKDKPKSAIHWRSQNTIRSIMDNLVALQAMFDKSGLEGALPEDQVYVANDIRFDFKVALDGLKALDRPVDQIVSDKASRDKLVFVYNTIGDLVRRFDQDFAIASGLAAGFSFADGD